MALTLSVVQSRGPITDYLREEFQLKYLIEGNDSGFENVYKHLKTSHVEQMMPNELEDGGKVYLVYPVIEQSEQLLNFVLLKQSLKLYQTCLRITTVGLLHGKLNSDEKDEALRHFRSGETHIFFFPLNWMGRWLPLNSLFFFLDPLKAYKRDTVHQVRKKKDRICAVNQVIATRAKAKRIGVRRSASSFANLWFSAFLDRLRANRLVSRIHYRAKHKYAEKLLHEVDGYETTCIGDHLKLHDKVSVLMHCDGFHDLIANKRAGKQYGPSFKAAIDGYDASLARRKCPSIILGSSPLVALYDENPVCSETTCLTSFKFRRISSYFHGCRVASFKYQR
ncbi:hypothetical protein HS088_TW22G01504 [Tripterygium wilfordii]|uniref:Uncharacterized protein n=1 Tax=Tripterygium wilfordii TaxID=458696 RepID=A0A7J7C1R6_TRIWF|nr:hypothetical protein HS088_TW22G01504 [Tripterygium wilfordii]